MRACIFKADGKRPSYESYTAYTGFKSMGWEVDLIAHHPDPDPDCVYYGPTEWVREALDVNRSEFRTIGRYPHSLRQFMDKQPRGITINKLRELCQAGGFPPMLLTSDRDPQSFPPIVVRVVEEALDILQLPGHFMVNTLEPIQYLSEYRYFISSGNVLGFVHKAGDHFLYPDSDTIKKIGRQAKQVVASSFVMDIAICHFPDKPEKIRYPTLFTGCYDCFDVGCEGMSPRIFATMLSARWNDFKRK